MGRSLSLSLSSNRITVKPTIFYGSNVSARNCGEKPPKAISTLAMKPDETSLPTVSGKVPKGPSVTSMCVTWMPGPMVTWTHQRFLRMPQPRRSGSMKPPASNKGVTSHLWSTTLMALPPRTRKLQRNALPASSQKSGVKHTQRWSAFSRHG